MRCTDVQLRIQVEQNELVGSLTDDSHVRHHLLGDRGARRELQLGSATDVQNLGLVRKSTLKHWILPLLPLRRLVGWLHVSYSRTLGWVGLKRTSSNCSTCELAGDEPCTRRRLFRADNDSPSQARFLLLLLLVSLSGG